MREPARPARDLGGGWQPPAGSTAGTGPTAAGGAEPDQPRLHPGPGGRALDAAVLGGARRPARCCWIGGGQGAVERRFSLDDYIAGRLAARPRRLPGRLSWLATAWAGCWPWPRRCAGRTSPGGPGCCSPPRGISTAQPHAAQSGCTGQRRPAHLGTAARGTARCPVDALAERCSPRRVPKGSPPATAPFPCPRPGQRAGAHVRGAGGLARPTASRWRAPSPPSASAAGMGRTRPAAGRGRSPDVVVDPAAAPCCPAWWRCRRRTASSRRRAPNRWPRLMPMARPCCARGRPCRHGCRASTPAGRAVAADAGLVAHSADCLC